VRGENARDRAGARGAVRWEGWKTCWLFCRRRIATTASTITGVTAFRLNVAGDFLERFR